MTRKRIGAGLLETFTTACEHCEGRGLIVHDDPVDNVDARVEAKAEERSHRHNQKRGARKAPHQGSAKAATEHPMVVAMRDLVESDDHDLDQEFEELAASVIVLDDSDLDDVVNDNLDAPERVLAESTVEPEEGQRRRARRRRGAHNTPAENTTADSASDIAAIAEAAVSIANEEDPDEPSGSSYVSDLSVSGEAEDTSVAEAPSASYEQAVAEFEASPRRRRKTRGNSRSDHAPKREDFARREQVSKPVQPTQEKPAVTSDAAEAQESATPEKRASRRNRPSEVSSGAPSTRSRRRAVRRRFSDVSDVAEVPEAAEAAEVAEVTKAPETAPTQEKTQTPQTRRRRRRAVRVTSGASEAPQQVEKPVQKSAPQKKAGSQPKAPAGRRRRATRRSQRG